MYVCMYVYILFYCKAPKYGDQELRYPRAKIRKFQCNHVSFDLKSIRND